MLNQENELGYMKEKNNRTLTAQLFHKSYCIRTLTSHLWNYYAVCWIFKLVK